MLHSALPAQNIFASDEDQRMWLETVGEACGKNGWWVHAFVMMNNHFHLLVENLESNLVAGIYDGKSAWH